MVRRLARNYATCCSWREGHCLETPDWQGFPANSLAMQGISPIAWEICHNRHRTSREAPADSKKVAAIWINGRLDRHFVDIERVIILHRPLSIAAALLGLAGCNALLPRTDTAAKSAWESYDAAKRSFERVTPFETKVEELSTLGLDPEQNSNVTILTYSDIIRRFAPGGSINMDDLDKGVRDCITARERCRGYELDVKSTKRKRNGNFWLDSLNFKRHTDITGWRFTGLVVVLDDTVVYKLHGGQPKIQEAETTRNPLGPLQGAVESAARRAGP